MNAFKKMLGIAILALSPFFVQAQLLDPVSYEITEQPDRVQAGEVFNILVKATIEGEWHLYSIHNDPDAGPFPTQFSTASSDMAIAGPITETEAPIVLDPNFNAELGWHSKEAEFTIPIAFRETLQGEQQIALEVLYQVCDDTACLPPKTKSIEGTVVLEGVADNPHQDFQEVRAETAVSQDEDFKLTSTSGFATDSLWAFLWIALTAGFAALLTPCVFPLIPLTVSYFSNEGTKNNKNGWGQAVIFGLSIVFIFTLLGALLSLILGVSGVSQFASNPWVNLIIGLTFILFGVSLLGLFELRLPHQLTNWLNKKSNESGGVTGTLFMAGTISAVSFSCTAPFVGAVLAATTGGEWFAPIIGMLGFSVAFASPFVLFAMFPGWLSSLPKSGSWMNVVKVILGFVILAASVKFLSNADIIWGWDLITRPLGIAAWITFFFLAGFYVLGMFALHGEEKPKSISTGRLLLALPMILFSFYLIPGLLGASLGVWDPYLPARQSTDVSVVNSISMQGGAVAEDEEWSRDYEASVAAAIENDMPLFVDFTGYTCTNCRAMEANVFPVAGVQNYFSQMQKVKLYTDGGSDAQKNQAFQFDLTGTLALPTYAIVDPNTGRVLDQLIGYTRAEPFQEFLERGVERYQRVRARS
ncbi:MAG: cytochrome c biogenesis protein CcdA [Balneolaceae bacterium]